MSDPEGNFWSGHSNSDISRASSETRTTTTTMMPKSKNAPMSSPASKYIIAGIFMWMVHTWTTIALSSSTNNNNNNAYKFAPPPSSVTSSNTNKNMNDYALANLQSNGFFDDISQEHWKTLQTYHAQLFPNYYANLQKYSNHANDAGKNDMLRNSNMWYGQNFQVEFVCPLMRRLPSDSMADGPKWVCNPHRIAKQKDCLIYSVGSNGKAEFEKAVKEEIGDHCEIHTFDPEYWNRRNGDFATALKPYSTFHHWGFNTHNSKNGKYKTLVQTMEELGHTGRTIDIFKIDCEWCEWFTWQEWLTVDMRQILVETHNAPMPNARDMFFSLHDEGFVIFSKEANYENGAGGVEYAFVKVSTDFFLNDTMYNKAKNLPGL